MKLFSIARSPALENKAFLLLLILITLAFGWILAPYFGAVFWGAIFALMFKPLFAWLLRKMPAHRTGAAMATVLLILLVVMLPLGLILASLVQEAAALYERMQTGQFSFGNYFQQVYAALPEWVLNLMQRFDLGTSGLIIERVSTSISKGSQFLATQALNIGQNAFDFVISFFVMLYVLFFLLRDGQALSKSIEKAIPLESGIRHELSEKFVTVIRATVRGNVVVAALQGALGGLIFWMLGIHAPVLWGTLMAFLSLLPAVGAALVMFMATWQLFAQARQAYLPSAQPAVPLAPITPAQSVQTSPAAPTAAVPAPVTPQPQPVQHLPGAPPVP